MTSLEQGRSDPIRPLTAATLDAYASLGRLLAAVRDCCPDTTHTQISRGEFADNRLVVWIGADYPTVDMSPTLGGIAQVIGFREYRADWMANRFQLTFSGVWEGRHAEVACYSAHKVSRPPAPRNPLAEVEAA